LDFVPFLSLEPQHKAIEEEVTAAFRKVYGKNHFVLGSELELFEKDFATFSGMPFCVGVASGLDALTLSLASLGIGPGDEVILPAHTFLATWLSVIKVGATPVAVDANDNTFNIDSHKIVEAIRPCTKAIIPVHLYGQACNMTEILDTAERFNLPVVEDNAQGHGATWLQKPTGGFGTVNATSFYPTKNLGALGDGGAITLADENRLNFLKRNRNYGMATKNHAVEPGLNSRLDELQAAILRIKLKNLNQWNHERRTLADHYLLRLQGVGDLQLPLSDKEAFHVYHLFVIRSSRRDELKDYLRDNGIETMIHYPIPPHLQHAFKNGGYKKGSFPVAERIAERCLSLPLWPGMSEGQLDYICHCIETFFAK
jgi:dTDP-4-amino-4,6-dideoxygalactose transaminase